MKEWSALELLRDAAWTCASCQIEHRGMFDLALAGEENCSNPSPLSNSIFTARLYKSKAPCCYLILIPTLREKRSILR